MLRTKPITCLILILLFCLFGNTSKGQIQKIRQELHSLSLAKDSIVMINSLNKLGTLYRNINTDSCFYYGMQAKRIATNLHYQKGATDADLLLAHSFFKRGLYAESLDILGKVLPFYQKTDDIEKIIRVHLDMVEVLNKGISDRKKIVSLLQKAIETGTKLQKDSIMSEVYITYCNRNPDLSTDSIKYYLSKSKAIASRYNDEYMLSFNLLWQARLLILNGEKQQALPLIKQLISNSQRNGNPNIEINSLFLMTGYYDNKPKTALDYLYQTYHVAQKSGDSYLEIYILNNALEFAKQLGDKDEIIKVYVELEKATSAEWEKSKKFISDYVKYNAIQDDNKLLSKKNEQKTGLLIALGISLMVTVFALFKLWNNRKKLLNLNKKIWSQNSNMQKTLNALEQSQANNTRMMQIVAHDLRNPIGGIYSIASMMLDEDGRTKEDREGLEMIKTSGKLSLDLVNDLLLAHTKTNELEKEPVDLGDLLQYCVDLLRHKAALKEQQIDLQVNVTISVLANQEKLWRVVSNLIANAIKFSPNGSSIQVALQKEAEHALISVKDNGIGIPKEIASKIFDMFTDAKRIGTAGEQSFGLGLAISKQLVEAQGGKLWFESEPESGTIFYVELPIN
ncbi:sensor histidine kinase [Pedobacter montanisoli]|uniref:histidine kinase n=1 Tax=Pedobacter montanisoli TaxID=2923277 RepID=A0ABS9ZZI2_9SPHI|nr:HAMP domain-containing sensor histidine kinase [Pedobacter montanisoli]MCJ0743725.1 HAMP domain-containing histidine kinase [Pedobacter montanisoli]